MFSVIPSNANDPQGLMRPYAPNKQITMALKHEERRCQYLSTQAKILTTVHDDIATLPEDSIESPYRNILERRQLEQHLSQIQTALASMGRSILEQLD